MTDETSTTTAGVGWTDPPLDWETLRAAVAPLRHPTAQRMTMHPHTYALLSRHASVVHQLAPGYVPGVEVRVDVSYPPGVVDVWDQYGELMQRITLGPVPAP